VRLTTVYRLDGEFLLETNPDKTGSERTGRKKAKGRKITERQMPAGGSIAALVRLMLLRKPPLYGRHQPPEKQREKGSWERRKEKRLQEVKRGHYTAKEANRRERCKGECGQVSAEQKKGPPYLRRRSVYIRSNSSQHRKKKVGMEAILQDGLRGSKTNRCRTFVGTCGYSTLVGGTSTATQPRRKRKRTEDATYRLAKK